MKGQRNSVLLIDTKALKENLAFFKSCLNSNSKIILVLKANAYGIGAVQVATLFDGNDSVEYYAVATVGEGIELRLAGISKRIMVLTPSLEETQLLAAHKLEPVVFNTSYLQKLIADLTNSEVLPIHINLDTGMHRLGFTEVDIELLVDLLNNQPIKIATVFSHYSASGSAHFDAFSQEQSEQFERLFTRLKNKLDYAPKCHQNNSFGIERFGSDGNALHRLGIGFFGISAKGATLSNVVTWKAPVIHIQTIKAGESVSYNRSWIANKTSTIATLPVGYADGLNRKLSNNWSVEKNGAYFPIVGDICMDLTLIDVTNQQIKIGDELNIISDKNTVELMADKLNTISYEVFTSLSNKIKRVFT